MDYVLWDSHPRAVKEYSYPDSVVLDAWQWLFCMGASDVAARCAPSFFAVLTKDLSNPQE